MNLGGITLKKERWCEQKEWAWVKKTEKSGCGRYLATTGIDTYVSTPNNSSKTDTNNNTEHDQECWLWKDRRKSLCGYVKFQGEKTVKPKYLWENGGAAKDNWVFSNSPGWPLLVALPPPQSLDIVNIQKHLCLPVLTGTCALGKSPLLCSQLLFLLQVGDEAGFPHLTPYSRGKTHVEGGSCRGHVFWSQSSEDGQNWLRSSKMRVTNF